MATSGSTGFALTGGQIVDEAFRILGILADGEALSAEDADNGLRALNLMVKTEAIKGRLWLKTEGSITLVTGQQVYALPLAKRVLSVRRRTGGIDTPVSIISRDEYFDLPTKAATGTPVNVYPDYQRATTNLYVWPTAAANVSPNTTLEYTYARVIEDFDARSNDPDLPQEWLETLCYGLADRLALRYGVDKQTRDDVKREALTLWRALTVFDDESASVFLSPMDR